LNNFNEYNKLPTPIKNGITLNINDDGIFLAFTIRESTIKYKPDDKKYHAKILSIFILLII
jgi:hypothetical protein